jgi:1-acyl-sn-glycerol-3-phosphate acyltransferase
MGTFFQFIYGLSGKYRWVFAFLLLSVVVYAALEASRLRFTEDISKVLPHSEKIDNLNFVFSHAKFMDKIIVNISFEDESIDPDRLSVFANHLIDSLESKYYPEVISSFDRPPDDQQVLKLYDEVYENLPLFLTDADYLKIDSLTTAKSINLTLEANYKTLVSPVGLGAKRMIARDPLHLTPIALNKLQRFQLSENLSLYDNHFISIDHKNLLVIFTPASTNNTAANQLLFNGMDTLIEQVKKDGFSKINVEYFGSPLVALGNAQRIKKDIILTVSIALVLLVLFISLFFRRKRTFFIIFLPVLFGALVSIAALHMLQSEVSAISLGIGSVLLGISLDFALHIFSHYRAHHDIRLLLKDLSTPVVLSSLTTAGAFLSLYFVNSQALNDLGLFAAIAVLAAALFSLVILPHLLPKDKQKKADVSNKFIDRLASYNYSGNKYLSYGIVLLTIIFVFLAGRVSFDADMMKSNYMSEELATAEENLNRVTNLSQKTIYLVSPGKDLVEAISLNESLAKDIVTLENEGIIREATMVTDIFHSRNKQQEAITKWDVFWSERKDRVLSDLAVIGEKYTFNQKAFNTFELLLNKSFATKSPEELPVLSSLFLDNFSIQTDTLSAIINVLKVNSNEADISNAYKKLEKLDSAWIIDKRLITSEFMRILKENFDKLIYFSLSFVFVILLLAYGRIELTILTMIPIFFSWIWVAGIMAILGISFNIFNIIILTFVFGLGIDYSIFIMRGLLQDYKYGNQDISSYKVSVIISGITTLLGIGVLIFAKHPALKSIATMSIIGILSVILITFTLLPAIFKWMMYYKKGKRNRPVTLLDFLFSLASLFVFVGGSLLMTLFSFMLRILPGSRKKKKNLFHVVFSKMTWFLIYMNFLSPKRIINPDGEDYGKPALVIANHQSHIDLMLMMLLNPKVLVLTNRRNYTHPFYGKALQYADFLPSDMGYEEIGHDLERLIADGYSFMIFPEGHRNDDGTIRRFHKGAFYLAEKLKIDVLPIIIHGQNQLLKKSEFFLKRGSITTRFLPRIDLSKKEYGETIREQTKGINKWFRKEYAAARQEFETPDYWADYIVKNFTYKGPVLEWYTRIKLSLEDNYNYFNSIIPRKCRITDLGCGYGYLDFMLSMVSEERSILAIDYDEDKIAIAKNCAINNDRIAFVARDITTMEFEPADVFILNDVLHYFPRDLQIHVIEKCIQQINTDGTIIIRDSDKDLQKRHTGTRLTEFFSTNFGFNKKEYALDFVSRNMIIEIAMQHDLHLDILDNTKMTSNLVYLLRKQ